MRTLEHERFPDEDLFFIEHFVTDIELVAKSIDIGMQLVDSLRVDGELGYIVLVIFYRQAIPAIKLLFDDIPHLFDGPTRIS